MGNESSTVTKLNNDLSWIYDSLPWEINKRICTCLKKPGWSLNPETGYWTCSHCNKPSYFSARLTCDGCLLEFIGDKARDPEDNSDILCYICLQEDIQ